MRIETDQVISIARLGGKAYVVPLWLEVPLDTALTDIEVIKPHRVSTAPTIVIEQFETGSKGDEYLVRVWSDDTAECECWGYRRHKKDCKHIKAARVLLLAAPVT